MKNSVQLTSAISDLLNPPRRWRGFLPLPLVVAIACFGLSPAAQAVSPPPGGGYPNQTTAAGEDALFSLTIGTNNTAVGWRALYGNTSGNGNTADGSAALYSNTSGDYNTANGVSALYSNTTGNNNTADGVSALALNTAGSDNTANGYYALLSNATGSGNTAVGSLALELNLASNNTATGASALGSNTTGTQNTATGLGALYYNTTGSYNTADGLNALNRNTTGGSSTSVGINSLLNNTTGSFNTAVGDRALLGNTTGNSNIAVGVEAGTNLTTGSNNINIGNKGVAGESNKTRIGTKGLQKATFIAGISGVTVPGGVGVIVGTDGKLGTVVSSERFKDDIKPMDKASEAILSLQPVTFRYKKELDPDGIPQFGLVAEEVAKVDTDLVARDEKGKPYTVRYEAVNTMLLNEFLKEHRKGEEQDAKISQLKSTVAKQEVAIAHQQKEIAALTSTLQAQALQIQKVSARMAAADQSSLRVVVSD